MASKYDPLRDHLSARSADQHELTMSFDEVEQFTGTLPQTARARQRWWIDSASQRPQQRAWREAGWLVRSADLAAGQVVFARRDNAPAGQKAGAAGGAEEPEESWRSMSAELKAGSMAMLSAGVAAAVSLTHLPWLIITLLSIAIAGIAFAVTEAFTSREAPAKAVKWLSAAIALLVAMAGGIAVYHEEFDSSVTGLPFTYQVFADPGTSATLEGCREIVLPGPWRNPAPPARPLTEDGVNSWEQSQHGVDGTDTSVFIVLQGKSDQDVVIDPPQVTLASRTSPLAGPAVELSSGCGAGLQQRWFTVNLDQQIPVATFQNGSPFSPVRTGAGIAKQAQYQAFTISASDPEYFVVEATTSKSFARWYLQLAWYSEGRSGIIQIGNGQAPFATSAVSNPRSVRYLLPAGHWSAG